MDWCRGDEIFLIGPLPENTLFIALSFCKIHGNLFKPLTWQKAQINSKEAVMENQSDIWNSGYVTDLEYTHGF